MNWLGLKVDRARSRLRSAKRVDGISQNNTTGILCQC